MAPTSATNSTERAKQVVARIPGIGAHRASPLAGLAERGRIDLHGGTERAMVGMIRRRVAASRGLSASPIDRKRAADETCILHCAPAGQPARAGDLP